MTTHGNRVRRALGILRRQLPFLLAGAWSPDEGCIWFGPAWRRPHHHWLRMHVEALQILSAVATADDAPEELPAGVTRARLVELVEQGLHAACRTHVTDGSLRMPATNGPWGDEWQGAWWAYRMLRSYHLLHSELSSATRDAVRRLAVFEADRFLGVQPPTGVRFDTKMEENGWDAPLLAWASCLFPDHPHADGWEAAARLWAFHTSTVEADRSDRRWMDGRPVSGWFAGSTLHPDFTCENHGTFHPVYQGNCLLATQTASAYVLHGRPVPPQALHHLRDAMAVLAHFNGPSGMLLMVTGNDWPAYHASLQLWPLGAYFTGDPVAAELADAILDLYDWFFDRSDTGHIYGSPLDQDIGDQRYVFHTTSVVGLADLVPAMPEPVAARTPPARDSASPQPRRRTDGVRQWWNIETVTHRSEDWLIAAAWRSLYRHPLFTYWLLSETSWSSAAPYTGIGRLAAGAEAPVVEVRTHTEQVGEGGFVTSGVIDWYARGGPTWARQHLLWASLGDGAAVLCEGVQALQDIELTRNEGWAFSIINDLHNGGQRHVVDARGEAHAVPAGSGQAVTVGLGDGCVIDGKLAVRTATALEYMSAGLRLREDNGFASAQWDRLVVPGRIGSFQQGEWVRTTAVVLCPGADLPPSPTLALETDTLRLTCGPRRLELAVLPPYGATTHMGGR